MVDLKSNLLDIKYSNGDKLFEDNEWFNKYVDLVTLNKDTKREKYKTQIHHIIPRCYYKIIGEKINNNKDNLVNLQYKDHVLAHYYLTQCTTTNTKTQLTTSFILMSFYTKIEDFDVKNLDKYDELYLKVLNYLNNPELIKKRSEKCKKPVICIEEQIIFDSVADASKWCNGDVGGSIKGKNQKTAGGYHWAYLNDIETQQQLFNFIGNTPQGNYKYLNQILKDKKILCIETQELFDIPPNSKSKIKNTNWTNIKDCCNNKYDVVGGYHWAWADDINKIKSLEIYKNKPRILKYDNISGIKKPKLYKPVYCLELKKNFPSIKEAIKQTGIKNIGSCVSGFQSTAGKLEDGTRMHWFYGQWQNDKQRNK